LRCRICPCCQPRPLLCRLQRQQYWSQAGSSDTTTRADTGVRPYTTNDRIFGRGRPPCLPCLCKRSIEVSGVVGLIKRSVIRQYATWNCPLSLHSSRPTLLKQHQVNLPVIPSNARNLLFALSVRFLPPLERTGRWDEYPGCGGLLNPGRILRPMKCSWV
jgi:hypothetical protein